MLGDELVSHGPGVDCYQLSHRGPLQATSGLNSHYRERDSSSSPAQEGVFHYICVCLLCVAAPVCVNKCNVLYLSIYTCVCVWTWRKSLCVFLSVCMFCVFIGMSQCNLCGYAGVGICMCIHMV